MSSLSGAFAIAARDRFSRRFELAGLALMLVIFLFIFSRIWQVVSASGGDLGRYTVAQLTAYLLIAEVVVMGAGGVHLRIAQEVRSGDVVIQLLRPVHFAAFEVARGAGDALVRAIFLLGVGAPALILFAGAPELDWRGVLIGLAVLLPCALALEIAARVLIGMLAFWVEDPTPFYWVWQKLGFVLGGLMIPLDMYPLWLQRAAAWLPFQAIFYGPARTAVAFDAAFAASAMLRLLCWGAVAAGALAFVQRLAERRLAAQGG